MGVMAVAVRCGVVLRGCRIGGMVGGDVVGVRVARVSGMPRMRKGVQGDGSALQCEGDGDQREGESPHGRAAKELEGALGHDVLRMYSQRVYLRLRRRQHISALLGRTDPNRSVRPMFVCGRQGGDGSGWGVVVGRATDGA